LVLSVTSPKGGVGKSTTSANLAAYFSKAAELSERKDVRVLLVDGDVANGNLALKVAHRLEPNMLDLLEHMDKVIEQNGTLDSYQRDVAPFVLGHPKISNLDILAAPDNPDVIGQIEHEDLQYLMQIFARFYQIIIFDTGTQIVEHTNCAWLAFSSQVYLMVEPELACLQSTREYAMRAEYLDLLTTDVYRLVMIRADMEIANMDPRKIASDVFSFISPDKVFLIPDFHRDAIETGNAGEFLTLDSAEYAAALTPLVQASLESYTQTVSNL
jgi:MinD-like ATPase involved in chromosome partitioning or flagellar assembly